MSVLDSKIPDGPLKRADAPVAFVEPEDPAVPASVVTTPLVITILRIVWPDLSATYRFVPSVVIPDGV